MTITNTTGAPPAPFDIEKMLESAKEFQHLRSTIPFSLLLSPDVEAAVMDVVQSNAAVMEAQPSPTISLMGLPFKVDADLPPDTVQIKNADGEIIGTITNIR